MRRWLSFLFVLLAGAALATVPRRPDSSSFAARCCADYRALDRFAGSQQVCTFEPTSTLNGGGVNTNVGYYYSQDNLGSSTVLSDLNGVRLETDVFYPFDIGVVIRDRGAEDYFSIVITTNTRGW